MYNLGFRVLLGRLCADNEDFYDFLAQLDNYLSPTLKGLKRKQNEELPSGMRIHPSPR